jgi:hypothetical protein
VTRIRRSRVVSEELQGIADIFGPKRIALNKQLNKQCGCHLKRSRQYIQGGRQRRSIGTM